MAQEEIKLIGSFKDDITPKLKKLNREITNIGRSFERFNKKIAPVTKSFAKMAMSARTFADAMQTQRRGIEGSARAMREYSRQAGKMSSAMRKVSAERDRARRAQGMSRAQARKSGDITGMTGPSKGGGKGAGAQMAAGFNGGVKSTALGVAIGNMAAQAIMRGVQGLKNLALAPFKKFGAMFSERIADEMDDIKSAGGLFALDMDLTQASGNERFFKNYNEALRFQEKLNIDMAESAASLPGVTSQYVSTSRQLTDTIQMVMEKDREGFNKMAEGFGANVAGGGVDASKEAMRTILQKQTEQVMLQSQGQTGGLPMHIAIQQLMGKEAKNGKIGMQAFTNKFRAAFQKNPLLKNFLLRAEEEMAKTEAGSVDRLRIIMETFDKAMPKEVINKMRGSISGMQEALRSGLLDPQAGLFGMSRANMLNGQKLMKKNVDDFGNVLYKITGDIFDPEIAQSLGMAAGATLKGSELTIEQLNKLGYELNKTGQVVKKGTSEVVGEISTSSTYIFEQIREIMAGYGPVLLEFVGFLPQLFDPFGEMTNSLMSFRDRAQDFISGFNKKLDILEKDALSYSGMDDPAKKGLGATLKGQSRSRAALSTVAEYLDGIGGINKDLLAQIQKSTGDTTEKGIKDFNPGAYVGKLIQSVLNSDLMKEFGKIGGLIIGGITKMMVDLVKGVSGLAQGKMGNKLVEGFAEGFKDAFGGMDIGDVLGVLADAAMAMMTKIAEVLIFNGIPLLISGVLKAIMSGFTKGPIGMLISGALLTGLITAISSTAISLWNLAASAKAAAIGAKAQAMSIFGRGGGARAGRRGMISLFGKGGGRAFDKALAPLTNLGKVLSGSKGLLAKLAGGAALGGVLSGGLKLMSGGSAGEAVTSGGLAALGAAIGTAIAGPLGTAIGGMAGGILGDTDAGKVVGMEMDKVFGTFWSSLSGSFEGLAQTFSAFAPLFQPLVDAVAGLNIEFDGLQAIVILIKIILTPIVATLQLLGFVIDAITFTIQDLIAKITGMLGGLFGMLGDINIFGQKPFEGLKEAADSLKNVATEQEKARDATQQRVIDNFGKNMEWYGVGEGAGEALGQVKAASESAAAPMQGLADATQALEAPMSSLPPSVDSATTAIDTFSSSMEGVPAKVEETLVGAASSAGSAITQAAQGLASALSGAASSIKNAASAAGGGGGDKAESKFDGIGGKMMPLGAAIAQERANMPAGANLVIANSSETVIPAFKGHVGDSFKGLSFAELESAAGFDRMATYTEQISEIADKTAASFSGGFGGALGGGSATLNAMEALGHSFGLITTSGHRPGDPGFHGVNRARDLSNGGGETPEMNAAAAKMASQFGSSLTELIYTPMGFSIKNGQKTGLISPSNHYHHIHVAVAEGLQKAAVFSSQKAAEAYERANMPSGAEPMKVNLASMTANSSEFGGGGITVGDVNVVVNGADNPREIANEVAEEILNAIRQTSYTEIFSS